MGYAAWKVIDFRLPESYLCLIYTYLFINCGVPCVIHLFLQAKWEVILVGIREKDSMCNIIQSIVSLKLKNFHE